MEDGLAEVRIMSKGIQEEQQAVNSAQTFLKLEEARYETGIDPYVDVLIAQNTLLANQLTLNNLQVQEMTAAVALIEALGGGWDRSQLPNPQQVTQKPASTDTSIQQ
jgi:outer membrane protein TolC